jgi:hypothetical protein
VLVLAFILTHEVFHLHLRMLECAFYVTDSFSLFFYLPAELVRFGRLTSAIMLDGLVYQRRRKVGMMNDIRDWKDWSGSGDI